MVFKHSMSLLRRSQLLQGLLLAFIYFVAARFGLLFATVQDTVTLVWPPSGIAIAAVVLFGPRLLPGIFLGAFLVNMTSTAGVVFALGTGVGNTLAAAFGLYLLRTFDFKATLAHVRDVIVLVVLGAGLSPLVSALIGCVSVIFSGLASSAEAPIIIATWWMGDAMGILLVTPLILIWRALPAPKWRGRRLVEVGLLMGLLLVASGLAFHTRFPRIQSYPLTYLIVPFIIWAAFRFGPRVNSVINVLVAGMAIIGLTWQSGPFVGQTMGESLALLWSYVATVTITSLLLATALRERKQADNARRESETRYRIVSSLISDYAYAFTVAPDGKLSGEWASGSYTSITGYTEEELFKLGAVDLYRPEYHEQVLRDVGAVASGQAVTAEYGIRSKSGEPRWVRIYRQPIWDETEKRVVRFYGVAQDITAQKQAETMTLERERLITVLKKEQEWNAAIQRMMKVFSHELRTPLAIITTASDMLGRYHDQLTPEGRHDRLASIQAQVRRVNEILEDVVQVVQGAFNHSGFKPGMMNLEHLCQVMIAELQVTIGAKHRMVFSTDGSVRQMYADENLVTRILVNLLSNAIKYSPQGSEIRIGLCLADHGAQLSVTDEGGGISDDDQQHIFEPFYRTEDVGDISGTGLGLNIVKDCVDLHGGKIMVDSALGQGSTFTIWLPLATEPAEMPI